MEQNVLDEKIQEKAAEQGKVTQKLDIKNLKMQEAPAGFKEVVTGGHTFYKSGDGISVFVTLEQKRTVHISIGRKSRRPEMKDIDRVVSLFVPKGVQPFMILPPSGTERSVVQKSFAHLFFYTSQDAFEESDAKNGKEGE